MKLTKKNMETRILAYVKEDEVEVRFRRYNIAVAAAIRDAGGLWWKDDDSWHVPRVAWDGLVISLISGGCPPPIETVSS